MYIVFNSHVFSKFDTLYDTKQFLDAFCTCDKKEHCFYLQGEPLKIYNATDGHYIGKH